MRRFAYPLAVALLYAACDGSLVNITVADEATTTVEAGTLVEEFVSDMGFGDFVSMDITASDELRNQGVSPGDITEVYFTLLELEAVSPLGADLSFLNSIDVYVEGPNLPRVRVAGQDDFPEGQARVALDLVGVDLTEYVVSQSMTFVTEVDGRRPDDDTQVTARFAVDVGVTSQGACNAAQEAR